MNNTDGWHDTRRTRTHEASLELCKVLEQASKSVDWRAISLVIGRRFVGSESEARASTVNGSGWILIQRHLVVIWNVSSISHSCGCLWPVVRCRLVCGIMLVLRLWWRRLVRDDVGIFHTGKLIQCLMIHFRHSLLVRLFHRVSLYQRSILRSTVANIPDNRAQWHVVLRTRHVRVTRQQVRCCYEEPSAATATVSRFVDRSRRLRTLCTVQQS